MERASKRLRSVTEEELSGDGGGGGKNENSVIVIDDSDSEFVEMSPEEPNAQESLDDLLMKLRSAIVKDDLCIVEQVLKAFEKREGYLDALNRQDNENEYTPLILAARQASVPVCRAILKYSVDVNVSTSKGYSALVFAAQRGQSALVFAMLRTDVSMICANTALIPASHFGREQVVRLLVKYGANVNHANPKGTTALMRGAQEGHLSVLKFLLRHGADTNASNGEGMTALMLASQRGHRHIVSCLLQYGARVDMRTRQGSTALLLASKRGREGAVIELITAGANIYLRDERQKCAADLAQRRGYYDLLRYLNMSTQMYMMQHALRVERSHMLMSLSILNGLGRASLRRRGNRNNAYDLAMSIAMKVPTSILHRVAQFTPLPPLYDRRLEYLRHRMRMDPHDVVMDAMPMFDELLGEASASVRDLGGGPASTTVAVKKTTGNLLFRLGQDSAFEYRFRRWGPLPLPLELLDRMKKLGHVQASLGEFGAEGLRCSRPIAEEAVQLLESVLGWLSQLQQQERTPHMMIHP